jgi:xanthine dehydrogenase YagS FAD-binding subunit
MRAFSYAKPGTTSEALKILNEHRGQAAVLAGGTDLLSLMKDSVVAPAVVVNVKSISKLSGISQQGRYLRIGATTTLTDLIEDSTVSSRYPSLVQAAEGIASPQIRNMGTVGGDLCQRPRCWYFRQGFGLLATHEGRSMVEDGDNRYHAVLGNAGPARFVNPSSLAPALIALGAEVEISGPSGSRVIPLADFFRTPQSEGEKEYVLGENELLMEVRIPLQESSNATYEVRQRQALDWPLAAAAVSLNMDGATVRSASVVLGHVAPVPWVATAAAEVLRGRTLSPDLARQAGEAAVRGARALSRNGYKIQLARVAAARAILRASETES